MHVLCQGTRGFRVELLQRLLNKAARRDHLAPPLPEPPMGTFSFATYSAVRDFQRRHRPLVHDGQAGPQTWLALGLRVDVEHRVALTGQPNTATCWSAAASMLLASQGRGQSVEHPVEATA